MKFSENRLKSIIEKRLEDYTEQEDYEYGEPAEAARAIMKKIDNFVDEISSDLDQAGEFLRPGLKKATLNYLKRKFRDEV